ncbi:MAG: SDR family NAD(P)-dependent oxidoreductase [Chitinophagaceae bacterium]|nr:SDR family NAD(P)-dependent oxidoreductase [Anaerolineae bacterium]
MQQGKDKVMLITGSNSGIGNATAKLAVEAGYIVYGGARRQDTFPAIQAVGAHPLCIDVTNEQSMTDAVKQIEAKHGAVDVLINNAGYGQMGPVEAITHEQWLHQYETNVFGLVRMAQLVIPAMRQEKHGRIINISSMGGQFTFPLAGAYHSTKYAVESINEALRFELKPFGIDVITIQPGPVTTPLAHSAINTLQVSPESPYNTLIQALQRISRQSIGYLSAERVAKIILRAAQAPHPKPRYKIGTMAHTLPTLHTLFSDRMWDRMMARFYA